MSDEKPAPDFAMVRAVEVLAKMAERMRMQPVAQPRPLDRPVVLFNEAQQFAVGVTRRGEVERSLGIGFPFPYKGWSTWGVMGSGNARWLLSALYRNDVLAAVEHYVPKSDVSGPALAPRNLGGFRFVPGEVRLGMAVSSLGDDYVRCEMGPGGDTVYDLTFQAPYPGGLALVMANKGAVTRLALYAGK